jgi:hypothetical protein
MGREIYRCDSKGKIAILPNGEQDYLPDTIWDHCMDLSLGEDYHYMAPNMWPKRAPMDQIKKWYNLLLPYKTMDVNTDLNFHDCYAGLWKHASPTAVDIVLAFMLRTIEVDDAWW